MKITKKQIRRIIKEERTKLLKEQGDSIADHLLGSFVMDLEDQLLDLYMPDASHRLGSEEDYRDAVNVLTVDVENFVRKRLGDLYAGDIRLELNEAGGSTEKYDDDSALKGDQSKLPDALQKGIIDKTVEDREEAEDKKKNEGVSPDNMPDAWRQILGNCLKGK